MWNSDTKLFELCRHYNWSFHHLYEVLTGCIGDVCPSAYGVHNGGNEFFSGLVNAHLVENPNEILLVDYLMDNLQNTYGLNTSLLQRILQASYEDELQVHRTRNLVLNPLNASRDQFI